MMLAARPSEMLWYSAREAARQLSAHVTPPISGEVQLWAVRATVEKAS